MSTRLTLFDSPMFLGFEQFERTIDRLKKNTTEGYPPYNIEAIGEDQLRITLAVAGFTLDMLDIELDHNQLTITGRQDEEGAQDTHEDRVFIYRGIASRQFKRSFVLADGIEIESAHLDNGLLHINMHRVVPEKTARKIAIVGQKDKSRKDAIEHKSTSKNG